MTKKFWPILISILICSEVLASEKFKILYVDKITGLAWGAQLNGRYSNGCNDFEDYFDDKKCTYQVASNGDFVVETNTSNAAKACNDIGARLPMKDEMVSLINNFDHSIDPYSQLPILTYIGRPEMEKAMGSMADEIWLATLESKMPQIAYFFEGWSFFAIRRNYDFAVRCVSR